MGGATAVQAILAAYIHRLRRGSGQYIDVSLVEAGLALTVWQAGAYFGSGEVAQATGTRHRRNAPYQAHRTSDGYVTIGGNTESMWRALRVDVLGRPELLEDPRCEGVENRLQHLDELEADIEQVTVTQPTTHWVARLEAEGVPGGPVYTYDEALADEHMVARRMVQELEHPRMATIRTLAPPAKLSATPLQPRLPPPLVGQHTTEVLAEIRFSDREIAALADSGTIHAHAEATA